MSETRLDNREPWRRWRMGELDAPRSAARPVDTTASRERDRLFQQQSELHALRERAREAAYREGHEAGFAEGRDQGLRQGLEEGRRRADEELRQRRAQLEAPLAELAEGFRQALTRLDTDIADTLVDVALAAGRRLAGEALDAHPEQVLVLIRDLLREEPLFSGHPRLWLHPDDLALVEDDLAAELDAAGWQTRPDPALSRGGCRVTGPEGEISATREQRWQALLARARRGVSRPDSDAEGETP